MILRWILSVVLFCLLPGGAAADDGRWALGKELNLPHWLRISGDIKTRFELVDNQFRRNLKDSIDQALFFKSHLLLEADAGRWTFGAEMEDARAYFDDENTPLSTGFVNPVELLQGFVRYNAGDLMGAKSQTIITVGRQTIDLGARRVIGRNAFRNTTNAFTGVRAVTTYTDGDRFEWFVVAPVSREPTDRESLGRNDIQIDEEAFNNWLATAFYRAKNLPLDGLKADAYLIGYVETDSGERQTVNRRYISPGIRLWTDSAPGDFDFEIEYVRRFGTRRATAAENDTENLVLAGVALLHAEAAYTFDWPFRTRLAIEYDLATGDKDPNDNRFNSHDRIFNLRRGDLGNASLFGPLAQENVETFGTVIDFSHGERLSGRLMTKATWLASATDQFPIAGLRDETGSLGRYTGFLIDGRVRYWVMQDVLRAEIGWSALTGSQFRREADGSPNGDLTLFGYTQLRFYF